MKLIPLTLGKFAMVDDEDYDRVMEFNWYVQNNKKRLSANRDISKKIKSKNGNKISQSLSQFILEVDLLDGLKKPTIFKDKNSLNCQRNNIETGSNSIKSQRAVKEYHSKKSKFLGVYFDSTTNKWRATISHDSKIFRLGRFFVEEDAAKTYNNKALELFGENARLNII